MFAELTLLLELLYIQQSVPKCLLTSSAEGNQLSEKVTDRLHGESMSKLRYVSNIYTGQTCFTKTNNLVEQRYEYNFSVGCRLKLTV